jgi:hypothetical protein
MFEPHHLTQLLAQLQLELGRNFSITGCAAPSARGFQAGESPARLVVVFPVSIMNQKLSENPG